MKKLRNKFKTALKTLVSALTVVSCVGTAAVNAFAADPGITIDFDPTQMFTYSNVIISCLMPVVYITAGLSLGFTVIYALKSAFGGRM